MSPTEANVAHLNEAAAAQPTVERDHNWSSWFAWRPVRTVARRWVWLRPVYRRQKWLYEGWEYVDPRSA